MANTNSSQTLADYCLKALGAPLIDIAINDEQLADRIEDAVQFFNEFNGDGTQRMYVSHQVTANQMGLADATVFTQSETLIGSVSGASVMATNIINNTTLNVGKPNPIITNGSYSDYDATLPNGGFHIGETITGETSGHTSTLVSWTTGDMDNRYVTLDPSIQSVIRVFPFTSSSSTNNLFDLRFQLRLSDFYALQSATMIQYEQIMYKLADMDMLFASEPSFRFNKYMNQVNIDMSWYDDINPGDYLLFEVYQAIDPDNYVLMYNDRTLKKLAKAYIKRQWAENLKLFSGVQLVGGVTVNGESMYQESLLECKEAEEHIIDAYSLPPSMTVG